MSNPIQDFLDKLSKNSTETAKNSTTKTTKKVSGRSATTASTKPKVSGQAKAAAKTSRPKTNLEKEAQLEKQSEMKKQAELQKQKEAIAKKTNQDIINAAYKVAEELKLEGGPWPLMRAAGWGHLTDDRGGRYKGLAIDEIEALTPEQKTVLKRILEL